MAWTKQQENAINARNTSIIVSAAAGSGKTSVLTERLVKLIADPESGVRADRMIVVTFTNDAAAEMKKRLDKRLRELINQNPGSSHLLKQQTLLQSAKISTINSFCFELIRDNITDQGITSGFGILDEAENKALKAQAMDELINWYSENEYDKISFLYDRFCIRNDRVLVEVISLADEFLASVALRDKWLETAENEYRKDFRSSVYFRTLMKSLGERAEKAVILADDCLGMIGRIFPDIQNYPQAKASFQQAEEEYDRVNGLMEIIRSGRFPDDAESGRLCSFGKLVTVTAKTPHNKELREVYKKKREKMKELVSGIVSGTSAAESDFVESAEVTFVLTEMLRKYQEIIWAKKCEKNAVSFDDGERLALEILADTDDQGRIIPSETARRTAEFYDIIMIDEYQDSNNKQDLIFRLISKNYRHTSDGEPMYGNNVFLVGDVKQSIYGFRLANPGNFISTLRNSVTYAPENNCPNQAIVLNKNFRSSRGVIDFVNFVFGQIMSEKCGGIRYSEDEMLYFGAQVYSDAGESCLTEIALVNDDPPEENDAEKPEAQDINYEAEYTADRIAAMINGKYPVITGDGTRPCRPSDFSILVRGNKFISVYSKALNDRGISAKAGEDTGYLKSREIAVLIDLLRIIDNPLSDVPAAAVMMSPMFMFTIQELAYIKSLDRDKPIYSVLLGLSDGLYASCTDGALIEKCRDFLGFIDSFRLSSVTMTIGELIGLIYDTTDFISVMEISRDGEKKRANLRLLIQYAQNYEGASAYEGTGGLSGFLRHIDRVLETGDYPQGKVSAASGDYVAIQTLHSSKGLEYPFVFIAETSRKFRCDSLNVMFSDDGRIGYNLYDPRLIRRYKTFQQVMLYEEEKSKVRSEEMRLLYVGMTRAKQKLFINLKAGEKSLKRAKACIDRIKLSSGDISETVCSADMFSDWLWASLVRHKEFRDILQQRGLDIPESCICFHDKLFDTVTAEPEELPVREQQTEVHEQASPDPEICREIMQMIGTKYDRSLSDMPAKLSVTQITRKFKKEDEEFDFRLKRPRFISEGSRLSGAERGTAIHTFFQYCDFESARSDFKTELERMIGMGYLSRTQSEAVDAEKVRAFFESSLYRRMTAAKNIWREKKFMVAVAHLDIDNSLMELLKRSDGMIKGIVDMMFEEDDGTVIVDYKSDRGVTAGELAERYRTQLQLYKSAMELTMKKKIKETYLYSVELKKEIPINL